MTTISFNAKLVVTTKNSLDDQTYSLSRSFSFSNKTHQLVDHTAKALFWSTISIVSSVYFLGNLDETNRSFVIDYCRVGPMSIRRDDPICIDDYAYQDRPNNSFANIFENSCYALSKLKNYETYKPAILTIVSGGIFFYSARQAYMNLKKVYQILTANQKEV